MFKRLMTLALTLVFGATLVTGCRTTQGLGEDVESAGETIQDVVD